MEKKMFTVPEGYFDDLRSRLNEIPGRSAKVTPWMKLRPYVAMAAMFAAIILAGTLILRTTVPLPAEMSTEEFEAASSPYIVYSLLAESPSQTVSEDDYIEYLIQTGLNIDYYETDY